MNLATHSHIREVKFIEEEEDGEDPQGQISP